LVVSLVYLEIKLQIQWAQLRAVRAAKVEIFIPILFQTQALAAPVVI
jgi:hypothetical protein